MEFLVPRTFFVQQKVIKKEKEYIFSDILSSSRRQDILHFWHISHLIPHRHISHSIPHRCISHLIPQRQSLAWKIPWTEEPGELQSMGSRRVERDSATSLSLFTFMHGEGNGSPLQYSCLENPRDGGAWWAAVYGVAQSRTQLK